MDTGESLSAMKRDIISLQHASDYRRMRERLRCDALTGILLGCIGIALGIGHWSDNPFMFPLFVFGIAATISSAVALVFPRIWGTRLNGAGLMALGAWSILAAWSNVLFTLGPIWLGLFGFWQVCTGWFGAMTHRRFAHLAGNPAPLAEIVGQLDELIKGVLSAKGDDAWCVVQFHDGNKVWKAKLFDSLAVMIQGNGEDVLFLDRERVSLAAEPADRKGKQFKISFQTAERTLAGVVTPEGLALCRRWKPSASPVAPPVQPREREQTVRPPAVVGAPAIAGATGGTRYWSFYDGHDY